MWIAVIAASLFSATPEGTPAVNKGPLDFRCDQMLVKTNPNRTMCYENVVVRRGDLLVCCRTLTAEADKQWQWQQFHCLDDVRAERGLEIMWADKGDYTLAANELVLTGRPQIRRGQSVMDGEKILVDTHTEQARVINPKGTAVTAPKQDQQKEASAPPSGPLPAVCPLMARPKR
jgi:lipopolysaccharide transport protein LptA